MRNLSKQQAIQMATAKQPPPLRQANSQRVYPSIPVDRDETTVRLKGGRKHNPAKEALLEALVARAGYGIAKYGTVLFTHNGRNAIADALFYINQASLEGLDCKDAPQLATQLGVCLLKVAARQHTKKASKLENKQLDGTQHDHSKGG